MVAVVGEVPQVFRCEGEGAHDGDSMLFPGRPPSRVYRLTRPPTICARPGRVEYKRYGVSEGRSRRRGEGAAGGGGGGGGGGGKRAGRGGGPRRGAGPFSRRPCRGGALPS